MRYRKAVLETRSLFLIVKYWKAATMTGKRRYRLFLKASRIAFVCAVALCLLLPTIGQSGSPLHRTFLCKENTITITQDASGSFHFQSTGRIQVEGLDGGSMTLNKGVPVYKFQDGGRQYWLWDGTEKRPRFGSLEVYEEDVLVLQLECARQPR